MTFNLRYEPPRGLGEPLELLSGKPGGPFIEVDSLTGMVGGFEDTVQQVVGKPGGVVDVRDRVVKPLEGGFTVVVSTVDQWRAVRRMFSTHRDGVLVLSSGSDVWRTPVRAAVVLPPPGRVPSGGARLEVSLVGYDGVWWGREQRRERTYQRGVSGGVDITNDGDVPLWPVWHHPAEIDTLRIDLPSGAQLKSIEELRGQEYTLPFDRNNAGRAWINGVRTSFYGSNVGESVPPGERRHFSHPGGVIEWRIGVFDPWT